MLSCRSCQRASTYADVNIARMQYFWHAPCGWCFIVVETYSLDSPLLPLTSNTETRCGPHLSLTHLTLSLLLLIHPTWIGHPCVGTDNGVVVIVPCLVTKAKVPTYHALHYLLKRFHDHRQQLAAIRGSHGRGSAGLLGGWKDITI